MEPGLIIVAAIGFIALCIWGWSWTEKRYENEKLRRELVAQDEILRRVINDSFAFRRALDRLKEQELDAEYQRRYNRRLRIWETPCPGCGVERIIPIICNNPNCRKEDLEDDNL